MKKIIQISIVTVVVTLFLSCSENDDPKFSVSPELSPFVESFYAEAQSRNVSIPKNLVAELKSTQAITDYNRTEGQNYLYFSTGIYEHRINNGMEPEIEKDVYIALSKLLLKRNISWANKEQFLNEAFQ
jgi:hypothetical protein